jgi:hypothetical protein
MNKIILEQLRNCCCIRNKQRTWIADLSDERLYQLFLRLRNGESCKAIARFIQNGWGVLPESSVHSLSQGILKFRKRIAHLLETPTIEGEDRCSGPTTGDSAPLGSLESLENIAILSRRRIQIMLAEEEKTGVRRPFLNRDLQALAALEKVLMKVRVFNLYHDDPQRQKKMAGIERDIGEKFGAAMDTIGEEGRIKIVKALDRFMELAKEHAELAEIGPDGKLRLVDRK